MRLEQLQAPTRQRAQREALAVQVAKALIQVEDASDAVSALLSVACAYLRLAEPDERLDLAQTAARLIVDNVRDSLS
jgi:hypothetical protein